MDRFARTKVGVGAQTLMKAWAFPHADDLAATRLAFPHVKPHEPAVRGLEKRLSAAWEARFAEEKERDD